MKRLVALIAIALFGLGCDNVLNPSRDVVLKVTGTGLADLTMTVGDFESQRSDVALPYVSGAFTGKRGDFVYISAQKGSGSNCITVAIEVDGKHFGGNTSCGAFVIATASGAID
jgi:hypothetical protein